MPDNQHYLAKQRGRRVVVMPYLGSEPCSVVYEIAGARGTCPKPATSEAFRTSDQSFSWYCEQHRIAPDPDAPVRRPDEKRGNCEACGKRRRVAPSIHGWHDDGAVMTLCRECDTDPYDIEPEPGTEYR